MYLMTSTRPDLAFTMSKLSKFFDSPTEAHVQAACRVLKYLKGTANIGITFDENKSTFKSYQYDGEDLTEYSDADFTGDVDNHKSTRGYVFILYDGAIS